MFLPRGFMYQKRQISLPVGYKTARPKTGDWEWLWRHFRTPSLAKNRFLRHFLFFLINNALLYHFLAIWLAHNKKMTEKFVFRKAWSPEMMSQSFPMPCFWPCGFVPHWKWNLTLLAHQNTGKENRWNILLCCAYQYIGEIIVKVIKKICHICQLIKHDCNIWTGFVTLVSYRF